MKKFKKIDEQKFNKLLKEAPEDSLLKAVLGGEAMSCCKIHPYANTTFYNALPGNAEGGEPAPMEGPF